MREPAQLSRFPRTEGFAVAPDERSAETRKVALGDALFWIEFQHGLLNADTAARRSDE
jgi:hypothetical protein